MTTEETKDTKINISEIVSSLIDDSGSTSPHQQSDTSDTKSVSEMIPELTVPTPTPIPTTDTQQISPTRKEHAKLYQREYRKRQKLEKEQLRETQVKGSEILMVFTNGQIVSRELRTEDDYVEMLNDFSESLKKQGSLLSFRISQRSF